MGLMTAMRNRGGLLVGVIGFAIVAFLIGDVIVSGRGFFAGNTTDVGVINGQEITYTDFQKKLEQNTEAYKNNTGQSNLNESINGYLVDQTWNQMIYDLLLNKRIEVSGVTVSPEELFDMVQGANPHPEVRRAFTNPQTGIFDPAQVLNFLKNMDNDPNGETRRQWLAFEKAIKEERIRQKYFNLVKGAIYVPSTLAKADYMERNKSASINYILLDYATVPDSAVKVAEKDLSSYYNANKYKYVQKENMRSFDYVYVDITPSAEDTAAVFQWANEQKESLAKATDDSLYIAMNSETPYTGNYAKKGSLGSLDSILFNAPVGTVYGPYLENNAYKVAKLISVKTLPDSVRARHILIKIEDGNVPAARAKADSINDAIAKGADFATMAMQFSTDGSKDEGGDLGYFEQGRMVKPFSDFCFNGKKGDRGVVLSQFGFHIVQITDQKNFSKQVQVGVVDRAVTASTSTSQALYAKLNSTLSTVKTAKDFESIELGAGLNKRVAENIKENDRFVAGLESPREVIRWAFKAKKGDVSPLFEAGDKYIFALLTQVKDKGYVALEYIKPEIEAAVKKEKKGDILKAKLEAAMAGTTDLAQIAQRAGTISQPASGVNFGFPIIPGVSREPKVVGAVFSTEKGKLSKVIAGEKGVYLFVVDSISDPMPMADYNTKKQEMAAAGKNRVEGEFLEALKEKAKIQDNRIKFY